ncbi:MAG TPA: hypothetical protein VK498_13250 [Ferruginibacter sp.]|nr:hypothetical protein [Ferruginibacter sp.]
MKALALTLLLFTLSAIVSAQDSAIYKRFPIVPPFSIIRVPDSTVFTKMDIKKHSPVIIMIFSPDCDHCQKATRALLDNYPLFKKAQVIMASPVGYDYIKKFYREYNIQDYPRIIMGRDPTFFFGDFYSFKTYPSIFVYDKKGKFVQSFEGSLPVKELKELLD